jgi:hypothetical protein
MATWSTHETVASERARLRQEPNPDGARLKGMSHSVWRSLLPVAPIVTVALLSGGCGDSATVRSGGPSGRIPRPTGPDEVVVQVLVDGGFVPPEVALGTVPTTTVLGDGTLVTSAPVPAIYPGPAVQPLQSVKVDAATVDGLLHRARDLGLLGEALDFGRPPVADAPNTTVTIVAGGQTHRHVAYAFGITDEPSAGLPGISASAAVNRRALKDFLTGLERLPPGEDQWEPNVIAVYDIGPYEPDPQLTQPPVAWPLAQVPSESGTSVPCLAVQADDLTVLRDALRRANARTPWVVNGVQRSLAFRPVVPGQPGCTA